MITSALRLATSLAGIIDRALPTDHSEANVRLSLEGFGDLFEKLAPSGQISLPPLGMLGRHNAEPPAGPANVASAQLPADQSNEMRHALDVADKGISDEGTNLLKGKQPNE